MTLSNLGVDPKALEQNGWNAFFIVACYATDHAFEMCECLYELGVDINHEAMGGSALMWTANRFTSFPELTWYLLDLGSNPKLKDEQGRTFWAKLQQENSSFEAISLLLHYDKYEISDDWDCLDSAQLLYYLVRRNIAQLHVYGKKYNHL
jgi:hypothetical protein